MLPELLQQYTKLKVVEIEDGMEIMADQVYIIPSNKDLSVHAGKLLLLEPSKPRGLRMPIDYFFENLASDMGERVVGVILSGMGADGELGLRMIKENLGMSMVQDPDTAEYDSMPNSSIQTGMVDYILPAEEMPEQITTYLSHPVIIHDGRENIRIASSHNALQKIFMLLRSHTGHDFSLYKQSTIIRRVERRIAFHQLENIVEYVHFLRENPLEIDVLFKELLIGVTKFFRDAPAFEQLKLELLPVLRKKGKNDSVRIWIAGCSTGEEAYSIAIILQECLDLLPHKHTVNVQLFATDLDQEAIEHARAGIYLSNLTGDVSQERLERYFIKKENNQYQIKKELREKIVFAQHNIIKDAPFTKLDLLCCRNLLIYLTSELQRKIFPVFHYSLIPTGLLFLGPSESVGNYTDLFQPLETKWKIFSRKDIESSYTRMIDFPFSVSRMEVKTNNDSVKTPRKNTTLAESFQKMLLDSYTPPSIVINDKGDIMYINGRMGKFMELNTGQAIMNVHRMIHEDLKYELGNAIHSANVQRKRVLVEG
ncbi:MAG: chemotaxis protein CheR, partial [Chitinophagaceae bacterium]